MADPIYGIRCYVIQIHPASTLPSGAQVSEWEETRGWFSAKDFDDAERQLGVEFGSPDQRERYYPSTGGCFRLQLLEYRGDITPGALRNVRTVPDTRRYTTAKQP